MKKFIVLLLACLMICSLSMAVACNKDNSQSSEPALLEIDQIEYLSGLSDSVYVGLMPSLKNLKIKVTYKDGTSEEISYTEENKLVFSVTGDTSELGPTTLEIGYNGFSFEKEFEVIFSVDSVTLPEFVNYFNAQKGETTDFADKEQLYVVGDDNNFYFSPIVTAWVGEDLVTFDEPGEVEIVANLSILNGEAYEAVENTADYVEIDNMQASFDFTDSAVGNTFKIAVYPAVLTDPAQIEHFTREFEFKVINGYNVYNALELLLWDNRTDENISISETYRTQGTYVKNFLEEKGLTVDATAISALVLHTNISLTADDLPKEFFYDEVRDPSFFAGLSAERKELLQGSLKDSKDIIGRHLGSSGTFAFEGNYFTVDASALPYVVWDNDDKSFTKDPQSVISHTNLFRIQGAANSTAHEGYTENFDIKNVNLIGNCNRQENVYSGGIIFIKTHSAKGSFYNTIAKRWYIAAFAEKNAIGHEVTVENCYFADSYNSMMYIWGGLLNIKNSKMIGAGGPVIIADHVDSESTTTGRTGSGGWITEITVDKESVLESYVTGQEGWFQEFNAQSYTSLMHQINEGLFNAFNRTFSVTKQVEGGETQKLLNIIVVFKKAGIAGMSFDPIGGKFAIEDTHSFDFAGAYTAPFLQALAGTGAPIFQSATEAGLLAYAGMNGNYPILYSLAYAQTGQPVAVAEMAAQPLFAKDSGYLNIFLGNNGSAGYLGVVLGDYKALA